MGNDVTVRTRVVHEMHLYRAGSVYEREPGRFSNNVNYKIDTTDARRIYAAFGRS